MRGHKAVLLVFLGLVLTGCASTQPGAVNDPYEQTNREIFKFNQKVDRNVLLPVAKAYVAVVPKPARNGLHNFFTNLDLPVTFANDVLQGEATRASQTFGRFGVNSTLGLGGLFDVASSFGIPSHSEDFGQTLAVYGVGAGPYLVLPILGPDNPRDATGQIADIFMDPLFWISWRSSGYWKIGEGVLSGVDLRAQNIDTLAGIERTSVDYYASLRSLYNQMRENEIRNGKANTEDLPDF
jgi:phospholipid-binding lipoprotein MlaA